MATNFPTSLDSYTTRVDGPGNTILAAHVNNPQDAIVQIETKLGIASSTPTANTVLNGTGVGTSVWTATPTIAGFTDITAGGLRVKGSAITPGVDTANTSSSVVIAAGSNAGANNTTAMLDFYRTNVRQGAILFDDATTTIGGVAMAIADLKFFLSDYRAFFDSSDSGRLVLGGGLTVAGAETAGAAGVGATGANITLAGQDASQVAINFYLNATKAGAVGFDTNTGLIGGVNMAQADLKFVAGGAYRAFLDNSDTGRLVLEGGLRSGAGAGIGTTVSTDNQIWTASQGAASTTLYIGNASINVTSDRRHKTDIVDSQRDSVKLLSGLRVRDFLWDDPSDTAPINRNSRGLWTGLIAQEIVNQVPWVVNAPDRTCLTCRTGQPCTQHEGFWHIEYEHLMPLTILGWQNHEQRIAALEAQLAG